MVARARTFVHKKAKPKGERRNVRTALHSCGHVELFRQMRRAAVMARSEQDDGARAKAVELLLETIEELERRGLMDALEPWLAPRLPMRPGETSHGLDPDSDRPAPPRDGM